MVSRIAPMVLCLGFSSAAFAQQTILVPQDRTTLADAIHLLSEDDSTIIIDSDLYAGEPLEVPLTIVSNRVTIRSTGGAAATAPITSFFATADITLEGLTFSGGFAHGIMGNMENVGGLVLWQADLVARDLILAPGGHTTGSEGILVQGGSVDIDGLVASGRSGMTAIQAFAPVDGTFALRDADIRTYDKAINAAGYATGTIADATIASNRDDNVVTLNDGQWTIGGVDPSDAVHFEDNCGGALQLTTKGAPIHADVVGSTFVRNVKGGECRTGAAGGITALQQFEHQPAISLTVHDSHFADNVGEYAGDILFVVLGESPLEIAGTVFERGQIEDLTAETAPTAGGSILLRGVATIDDSLFAGLPDGAPSAVFGGAIHALSGSDLTVNETRFEGIQAAYAGGAVYSSANTTLALHDIDVENTHAGIAAAGLGGFGGAYAILPPATIDIVGGRARSTVAHFSGGFLHFGPLGEGDAPEEASRLSISGLDVAGARSMMGSAVRVAQANADVNIHGSSFTGNRGMAVFTPTALGTATLDIEAPRALTVTCSEFCGNFDGDTPDNQTLAQYATSLYTTGGTGPVLLRNNIFGDHPMMEGQGNTAVRVDSWEESPLTVTQNTFLGSGAGEGVGLRIGSNWDPPRIEGNIFAGYMTGSDFGTADAGYNLWHDNSVHSSFVDVTTDVVDEAPAFWTPPPPVCGGEMMLAIGSPGVDVGPPDLLDWDGTRADIGAFGGPDACLIDDDDDGSPAHLDCDDTDPSIYPGAEEIPYDGIDQDCDGDDLCDVDEDGFDAPECGGDDCDDTDPDIHPDAIDACYDGIDANCDGWDDFDCDRDGYASADHADVYDGTLPATDCDDDDPSVHPGATEIPYDGIDQDCDGHDLCDVDGDGFDAPECGGDDCDDTDATAYPGATEIPYDGIDQDCDGDDLCDVDGDGFDAVACGGDDCDDDDPSVHPGAEEIANDGVDQDCNGHDLVTWVQGGSCATVNGAGGAGWLIALGLALARRRRADATAARG